MKTNKLTYLAISTALYVALSALVKVPIIAHIQTDLGYIVFGFALYMFGWQAFIVGAIGCIIESMLFVGWFPIGWALGQMVIGIICGIIYKETKSTIAQILVTILAVFIGVALIKTGVECILYNIPFAVKIVKNLIAFVADTIPMIAGLLIAKKYGSKIVRR